MSNKLETEDSPYLQQHKDNPVEWYPWCDEAFKKAQKENKAIFISIGYSSCHWCHIMEEEVFENIECADILNEQFICIKVDREERPDIDKHYQEVYTLLNHRAGGWPTSIFCTPQNKPFFAATYIPPETQDPNKGMGFKELTRLIGSSISKNDKQLFKNADEIENFLNHKEQKIKSTPLKESFVDNFMLQVKNNYEHNYGGFSVSPKFPHASTLNTLLMIDKLYDDKSAKAMLNDTLNNMKKGGLYDIVDGGFCRYSTDEKWLVPHFEKMLYDNALLCEVYTQSYLTYADESHLSIAKEIVDFWYEFMSEDNLFYSASDADSESVEGTYFVYTYNEVYMALQNANCANIETILMQLGISKNGNFEGKSIVNIQNITQIENYEKIKTILQDIRKQRPYPFIDKKIQVSWSSMMIKSLFTLGSIDEKYKQKALESLDALLDTMYIDEKLYHTTLIHKTPKVEAFLEDYAFLSSALLNAYKYTQNDTYLIQAQRMTNEALEDFYKEGEWLFSKGEFQTKAETSDNTYTSSMAVMVDVLISLGTLLEDEKYPHFAYKTLEYNSYNLSKKPMRSPYMLQQMIRYLKGDRVIKSTQKNLSANALELTKINYPFIQYKKSEDNSYMVCGDKSCFANTQNVQEINTIISHSF